MSNGSKKKTESPLEKEMKWFEKNRKCLAEEHSGKYAVVSGEKLVGVFDDFSVAFRSGSEEVGSPDILVKMISTSDQLFYAPAYVLGILSADS